MKKKQKAAVGKPKPQKDRQTPEKAGLTFSEKKRLAELKRILAGNSREQAKPDTATENHNIQKNVPGRNLSGNGRLLYKNGGVF